MIKWFKRTLRKLRYGDIILCDTCKYDYGDACRNSDRPNATDCDDYARKQ